LPATVLGVIFALTSAAVWGSGDFSGGVATRRGSQYHVLVLSALSGIVLLAALAIWQHETWPTADGWVWSALGGVCGALGIACLYRALSLGHAASVAPITGVVAAVLPVVVGALSAGLPAANQLAGFAVAVPGIWLVSASAPAKTGDQRVSRPELLLAVLAGLGFGGFFVFIGQVARGYVYTPLVIARSVTLLTGLLFVVGRRLPLPSLTGNPVALLAGVLDAGGNIFYVLARQYTRLDVAAVLSSLYPAATVLLAWLVLHEHISRRQWLGAALCVVAVALIAL
jgi:drug/metabolite transporter (DMT)-like permease